MYKHVMLQLYLCIFLSYFHIIYLIYVQPFLHRDGKRRQQRIEIYTEFTYYILLVFSLNFTDLLPNAASQYIVGYFWIVGLL